MDNITSFLSIGVVGAALALAIQYIKSLSALSQVNSLGIKLLTIVACVVVATVYYFAAQTPWWPTVLVILGTASTVYALFLKGTSPN